MAKPKGASVVVLHALSSSIRDFKSLSELIGLFLMIIKWPL